MPVCLFCLLMPVFYSHFLPFCGSHLFSSPLHWLTALGGLQVHHRDLHPCSCPAGTKGEPGDDPGFSALYSSTSADSQIKQNKNISPLYYLLSVPLFTPFVFLHLFLFSPSHNSPYHIIHHFTLHSNNPSLFCGLWPSFITATDSLTESFHPCRKHLQTFRCLPLLCLDTTLFLATGKCSMARLWHSETPWVIFKRTLDVSQHGSLQRLLARACPLRRRHPSRVSCISSARWQCWYCLEVQHAPVPLLQSLRSGGASRVECESKGNFWVASPKKAAASERFWRGGDPVSFVWIASVHVTSYLQYYCNVRAVCVCVLNEYYGV